MNERGCHTIKSRFCYIFTIFIFLAGCSGQPSSPQANQIIYKDKVLTYNTTEVDDVFFEDGIDLDINDSNEVRLISVTTPDAITYNNISVGDKIEKAESKYQYEATTISDLSVAISNGEEIDPSSKDKPDDTIWISYSYYDGIITKINIFDPVYGLKMK